MFLKYNVLAGRFYSYEELVTKDKAGKVKKGFWQISQAHVSKRQELNLIGKTKYKFSEKKLVSETWQLC